VSVFLVRVAVGVCFLHLSSFKIFPRRPDWLNPNGGRVVVCVVNAPNCRLPNTAMRRAVRLGVQRNKKEKPYKVSAKAIAVDFSFTVAMKPEP